MNSSTPADGIEQTVLEKFLQVAPDVDPAALDREIPFREQFDFDSMDTLNFAIELHKSFGIEVPETDYRQLASLAQATEYVRERIAHRITPPAG